MHGCIISKKRFDAFDRRVSNGLRDGFERGGPYGRKRWKMRQNWAE
ncbi:hypothetical protein B0042_1873 [Bifidobacterium adolescentis]|nr:hypothetical protein B0042_1873 [Bifidobacterium adolescentis]